MADDTLDHIMKDLETLKEKHNDIHKNIKQFEKNVEKEQNRRKKSDHHGEGQAFARKEDSLE